MEMVALEFVRPRGAAGKANEPLLDFTATAAEPASHERRGVGELVPALEEAVRLRRENEVLRSSLNRLSGALLRVTERDSLSAILQAAIDGARTLAGARYGALLVFDDRGRVKEFVTSGLAPEVARRIGQGPRGEGLLGHLRKSREALRLGDLSSHPASGGFPANHPSMKTFLGVPLLHRRGSYGNIYLTEKEGGEEFTPDDERLLQMFASEAAATIAQEQRFQQENRSRLSVEALINTSPVAVLVFDAKTRDLVSYNDETKRIVRGLTAPSHTISDLLGVMAFRRSDGRDIPPEELPTELAIRSGETVRAEDIVIHLPDGPPVPTLCNVTPIRSEGGEIVSVVATLQDMTPLADLERQRAEFLGMVSHELRMPLASIKGSASALMGPLHPPGRERGATVLSDHRPAGRSHAGPHQGPPRPDANRGGSPVHRFGADSGGGPGGGGEANLRQRGIPKQPPGRPRPRTAPHHRGQAADRSGLGQPALQRLQALARTVGHQLESVA